MAQNNEFRGNDELDSQTDELSRKSTYAYSEGRFGTMGYTPLPGDIDLMLFQVMSYGQHEGSSSSEKYL